VQLDYAFAPGTSVQAIHVLGNKCKKWNLSFPLCEGKVTNIGLHLAGFLPPGGIEFPHMFWRSLENIGRGEVFRFVLCPQPIYSIAEGPQAFL